MHRAPAAHQTRCRDAVVRAPERPLPLQKPGDITLHHGMDAQRLLPLALADGRQDGGHATRKHGLPRSRGTDHEHAESARRRDGQGPLRHLLPDHVGEVERIMGVPVG